MLDPNTKERAIKALGEIALDMENDAALFDGKPFNGRTVAEYFGNQGAAIAAIANILRQALDDLHPPRQGPIDRE